LAFKELKTSEFIIEQLREAGFEEIHTGVAETGIVAVLRG
jgi:hippurate hydrolase